MMKGEREEKIRIIPSGIWSWNWFRQPSETESLLMKQPDRRWS